jgi:DNA-binding NarL/FixJ family response regulator
MPVSIVVAQRSKMECELVCRALKAHGRQIAVLACVQTSEDLLKKVAEHRPEVTVISSTLQGDAQAGLKALRDLHALGTDTCPVMMVDRSAPELVTDVFSAGAKGIVCRDDAFEVLCKCIQCVGAGQVWANSQELQWILKGLADREPIRVVNSLGIPLLTGREEQIVRMVVDGLPPSEIATNLVVSAHTVKNHLFRIYEKLGVSNRSELILYALSSRKSKA